MFNSTLLNNNRSAYVPWKGKSFGDISKLNRNYYSIRNMNYILLKNKCYLALIYNLIKNCIKLIVGFRYGFSYGRKNIKIIFSSYNDFIFGNYGKKDFT